MRIPSGVTDQYIYFVAVDATDFTTRETGLSSFTVYRSRNGGTAAAMTTPTINETDTTNMPGVYELLLDEDMTIGTGNDSEEMAFHITHAGMAPVTRTIELYRPKITAGNTLGVASTGDISGNVDGNVDGNVGGNVTGSVGSISGVTFPTNFADLSITVTTGRVDVASVAGTAQTANDNGADLNTLITNIGTPTDFGSGTSTIAANLQDIADNGTATFDRSTDSLQALRDHIGDGTNLPEAGGTGDHLTGIPWNAAWDAEVQSECNDALVANNLDHLVLSAVDTNFATTVHLDSVIGQLADPGTTATFDRTTDSLEALRNHIGDGTNLSEAGGDGDHLTAINLPDQTMNITGNITGNLSGSVGSVTGAVGSVTGNVGGNVTGSVGSNLELGPAEVNAEVVDALNTDTYAEPGQGTPGATISLAAKVGYLYKAWRNRSTQTATQYSLYNDDATTVDHKATVSDDGTTADKGEVATGP